MQAAAHVGLGVNTVHLLVLAAAGHGLAGVDLASGALVRATFPCDGRLPLSPFDVVEGERADRAIDDPVRPEALPLAGPPTVVDQLRGRRAERFIRPLLHPRREHLLGFAGPSIPYWTLNGERPSVAVVDPGGDVVVVDRPDAEPRCLFAWRGLPHELPFTDGRMIEAMRRRWQPAIRVRHRLVVALTTPRDGRCHKVVAGLLPVR